MEYNPVAINEVLAYSFRYVPLGGTTASAQANRFFMELVNTQTAPEVGTATAAGFNPVVDLGGFVYNPVADASVSGTPDPYTGAPWDIIFTGDDPYSRPDPYRGQLVPYANLYAATPLSQASFTPAPTTTLTTSIPNNPVNGTGGTPGGTGGGTGTGAGTATDGFDVMLQPLTWNATTGVAGTPDVPIPVAANTVNTITGSGTSWPIPLNYFYVIGNAPPNSGSTTTGTGASATTTTYGSEMGSPGPATGVGVTTGNVNNKAGNTYAVQLSAAGTLPTQIQTFKSTATWECVQHGPDAVGDGAAADHGAAGDAFADQSLCGGAAAAVDDVLDHGDGSEPELDVAAAAQLPDDGAGDE